MWGDFVIAEGVDVREAQVAVEDGEHEGAEDVSRVAYVSAGGMQRRVVAEGVEQASGVEKLGEVDQRPVGGDLGVGVPFDVHDSGFSEQCQGLTFGVLGVILCACNGVFHLEFLFC